MAKFIDLTEIYGNCYTNNQSKVYGKISNDDLLYVSFSQAIISTDLKTLSICVRKFDNNLTTSGIPMVHFWFSDSGSDASTNQNPSVIDSIGLGTLIMSVTSGYMLDPTTNTTLNDDATLSTAIVNSTTHNLSISLNGQGTDYRYTKFLNAMVQGIVYSEKFIIDLLV